MFSVPFNVSAKNGKIFATHTDPALLPAPDVELLFRGTNWAGMQSHGCPNHLTWHTFEQYLDRLVVDLEMNLVRLPLSAEWINGNMAANNYICGEYRHMPTLSVLDDVLARLAARGVFVMLDMHTLHSDRNFPLWCDPEPCDDASEQAIFAAWATLAQRYCSRPNVIMADLFNEPRTSWESWREAAQRLGDHVLSYCDRWLIVVEGTGCNSNHGCWWGEHVADFLRCVEHHVEVAGEQIELVTAAVLVEAPVEPPGNDLGGRTRERGDAIEHAAGHQQPAGGGRCRGTGSAVSFPELGRRHL